MTLVLWDESMLGYNLGDHPLDPVRLELTVALARDLGVLDRDGVVVEKPRGATDEELLTVHTAEYLSAVKAASTDMGFAELGRFIDSMDRSGADVSSLKVERMLKIVIPVTCVIIFMFGAPLATSSQRGGTAYGIGLSLATTLIFLVMIQLTRGIGGHGQIPAGLAAWLPSLLFGVTGAVLLTRVRT